MKILSVTLANLFIVWHVVALLVAPAPEAPIFKPFQDLTSFYRRGLHLDSAWRMFVQVSWGGKVDYLLFDKDKKLIKQAPIVPDGLWFSSAHTDYYYLQYWVFDYDRPEKLVRDLTDYYCRKNAKIHPQSLAFLIHYQSEVPADRFTKSMDSKFVEDKQLDPRSCEDQKRT